MRHYNPFSSPLILHCLVMWYLHVPKLVGKLPINILFMMSDIDVDGRWLSRGTSATSAHVS
jgi:hypothetical protein